MEPKNLERKFGISEKTLGIGTSEKYGETS
jgi:hypothetical protein